MPPTPAYQISLRLTQDQMALLESYAQKHDQSVGGAAKAAILSAITPKGRKA